MTFQCLMTTPQAVGRHHSQKMVLTLFYFEFLTWPPFAVVAVRLRSLPSEREWSVANWTTCVVVVVCASNQACLHCSVDCLMRKWASWACGSRHRRLLGDSPRWTGFAAALAEWAFALFDAVVVVAVLLVGAALRKACGASSFARLESKKMSILVKMEKLIFLINEIELRYYWKLLHCSDWAAMVCSWLVAVELSTAAMGRLPSRCLVVVALKLDRRLFAEALLGPVDSSWFNTCNNNF